MPESIQVRPASIEDSQTIVDYQLAMAMETESLELHRPTVALGVAAVFDDFNKGTYWIAQCDNRIVGSKPSCP